MPLTLAERCISLGQGHVLDPFAGTGTTALAAQAKGRSWTLFDRSPDHTWLFEQRQKQLKEAIAAGASRDHI